MVTQRQKRLADDVVKICRKAELKIATAESCTGGMVATALTAVPGASEVFEFGYVTYANHAKIDLLGVSPATLDRFGAVSEDTARQMAEGAYKRSGADIAVAVTGIAGPDGGTADKPVGLVWFAVSHRGGTDAVERRFGDLGRDGVREESTKMALELLLAAAQSLN